MCVKEQKLSNNFQDDFNLFTLPIPSLIKGVFTDFNTPCIVNNGTMMKYRSYFTDAKIYFKSCFETFWVKIGKQLVGILENVCLQLLLSLVEILILKCVFNQV